MSRRPSPAKADPLAIPAFLLRPRPARNAPLPPFVLADRNGKQREWAPIFSNAPDAVMAKINAAIANRAAPVEVWAFGCVGPQIAFDDFEDFEAWYSPKIGKFMHANAQETFTQIILDGYAPPQAPAKAGTSAASGPKTAPRGRRKAAEEPLGFVPPPTIALDAPAPAGAKFTRNGVTVDGAPYRSVLSAFQALSLPVNVHQKFRKVLKQAGRLPFEHGGRTYDFVVVR